MNKSLFFVCRVMVWYYLEGAEGMRNFQDRALAYLVRNDLEGQQISEDFCRARLPLWCFSCVVVAGGRRSADIWNTDLRPMIKLKGIRCQFFGEWSVKNRLDLFRLSSEGSKNNFLQYSSFWSLWSGVLAALVIPSGPSASQVINRNGHLPDFWILFSDTWEAQWHQNDAQLVRVQMGTVTFPKGPYFSSRVQIIFKSGFNWASQGKFRYARVNVYIDV
jgi:hypothetical protein